MNSDLLDQLTILRDYHKQEGDRFRTKAYTDAIIALEKVPFKITSSAQVKNIRGIGKKLQAKIDEFILTGKIEAASKAEPKLKVKKSTGEDKTIRLFTQVWGIGEVKAKILYNAGMRSIKDLRKNQHFLNSEQKIGLKYYEDLLERVPRKNITIFQIAIRVLLNKKFGQGSYKMAVAGSYRRGSKDSGDLDIVMSTTNFNLFQVVSLLEEYNLIVETLSLKNVKFMGIGNLGTCDLKPKFFRLDIVMYPEVSWVPALFAWTGSGNFNKKLRAKASKLGYTLSDYSLYNNETGEIVPLQDEQTIFNILGEKYLSPNQRNL
jgi:DNA polymerase/3'-5' exonuclease PolX